MAITTATASPAREQPLTTKQAADLLGVSERAVLMAMQRGALAPAGRGVKRWTGQRPFLFAPADVRAYAAARRPAAVGTCDHCGRALPGRQRPDRRHCSTRCRVLAFYERHGVTEAEYIAAGKGRA